jgi:hypothetical protein
MRAAGKSEERLCREIACEMALSIDAGAEGQESKSSPQVELSPVLVWT